MKQPQPKVVCPWCGAQVRQSHLKSHQTERCPKVPENFIEARPGPPKPLEKKRRPVVSMRNLLKMKGVKGTPHYSRYHDEAQFEILRQQKAEEEGRAD